jgi:hypothetical protein
MLSPRASRGCAVRACRARKILIRGDAERPYDLSGALLADPHGCPEILESVWRRPGPVEHARRPPAPVVAVVGRKRAWNVLRAANTVLKMAR